MKRLLAGLLCIALVLIGSSVAMAGLAKKGPFFIVVKTYSTADAAALAASTVLPVIYTNTADGKVHYVTASGTDYDLTDTGGGGAGTTWFVTNDGPFEVAAGGTQYYKGISGVSTSGAGATIYFGLNSILAALGISGNTAYGPGDSVQLSAVSTFGVTTYNAGSTTFTAGASGVSANNISVKTIYFPTNTTGADFTYMATNDDYNSNIPKQDGFRFRWFNNLFGTNNDGLLIEKIDGNAADPDGGILFANTGMDGVMKPVLTITGNRAVIIGGVTSFPVAGVSLVVRGGRADFEGGVSVTGSGLTVFDTAGVTQFEVDAAGAHAKTPVTAKMVADKAYVDSSVAGLATAASLTLHTAPSTTTGVSLAPSVFGPGVIAGVSLNPAIFGAGAIAGASLQTVYATAAMLSAQTGASVVSGTSLSANSVSAWFGAGWTQADNDVTGNTVFVQIGYNMWATKISIMSQSTALVGVSIYWISGVSTATPNGSAASHYFGSASNGGAQQANQSAVTYIPVDSVLAFWPKTISNGCSAFSVIIQGRRE